MLENITKIHHRIPRLLEGCFIGRYSLKWKPRYVSRKNFLWFSNFQRIYFSQMIYFPTTPYVLRTNVLYHYQLLAAASFILNKENFAFGSFRFCSAHQIVKTFATYVIPLMTIIRIYFNLQLMHVFLMFKLHYCKVLLKSTQQFFRERVRNIHPSKQISR